MNIKTAKKIANKRVAELESLGYTVRSISVRTASGKKYKVSYMEDEDE